MHTRNYLVTLHFLQRKISVACLPACQNRRTDSSLWLWQYACPAVWRNMAARPQKGSLGCPTAGVSARRRRSLLLHHTSAFNSRHSSLLVLGDMATA